MLAEIVENDGVRVNVNGTDEQAEETVDRLPRAIDDDDGKIGGLSNENGLKELHRLSDVKGGSLGTTKRSLTKCFVGEDFFCALFGRCIVV